MRYVATAAITPSTGFISLTSARVGRWESWMSSRVSSSPIAMSSSKTPKIIPSGNPPQPATWGLQF